MKKILIVASFAIATALGACTSAQQQDVTAVATKAKAQIAQACTVVQPTLVDLQASLANATEVQKALINTVVTDNAQFCAGISSVDAASAQSLVNTVIPAIIQGLALLPIDPATKTTIQIAMGAASVALSNFIAVYGAQATAATQ